MNILKKFINATTQKVTFDAADNLVGFSTADPTKIRWFNAAAFLEYLAGELSLELTENSILVGNALNEAAILNIPENHAIARLTGANVLPIELVESLLSVGDFTGAYAGLAIESNWTNGLSTAAAGVSGDVRFGVGENGTAYYAYYSQFEWNRVYSDPRPQSTVFGLALITEIISANWDGVSTYNASSGDLQQFFINGGYKYKCIDGELHTWFREPIISNTLTITDATFIPFPAIKILDGTGTGEYTYEIPAKHDIIQLRAIADNTDVSTISIGSAAGLDDIVSEIALPTVVGDDDGIRLTYIVNPNFPTTAIRTIYIALSNADKEATLQIVLQKIF